MLRTILAVALLVGCGGDEDPHEKIDCSWSNVTTTCEAACAEMPSAGVDANSDGRDDTCMLAAGGFCTANEVSSFGGDRYCCIVDNTGAPFFMKAHACE